MGSTPCATTTFPLGAAQAAGPSRTRNAAPQIHLFQLRMDAPPSYSTARLTTIRNSQPPRSPSRPLGTRVTKDTIFRNADRRTWRRRYGSSGSLARFFSMNYSDHGELGAWEKSHEGPSWPPSFQSRDLRGRPEPPGPRASRVRSPGGTASRGRYRTACPRRGTPVLRAVPPEQGWPALDEARRTEGRSQRRAQRNLFLTGSAVLSCAMVTVGRHDHLAAQEFQHGATVAGGDPARPGASPPTG